MVEVDWAEEWQNFMEFFNQTLGRVMSNLDSTSLFYAGAVIFFLIVLIIIIKKRNS